MTTNRPTFWAMLQSDSPRQDDELRAHIGAYELSAQAMLATSAGEILKNVLGFGRSVETQRNVLGSGEPIPLMSYSFVEYAMAIDISGCRVLEIGGGQSTSFWCKRAREVVTLEHDPSWLEYLSAKAPANLKAVPLKQQDYVAVLRQIDGMFHIIVLDAAANRYECACAAAGTLAPGGFIVLDNSDWYPNTAAYLRNLDLIQVDFADFRGDRHYRCCTSMFLHPEFRARPAGERLPAPVLGGKDAAPANQWDQPKG